MDLRRQFHTDKRAETEGRKMFLDDKKEVWLLIARKTNPNYKAYLSKLLQANSVALNTGGPEAEALAQSLFKDAASKHLLIGWSPKGIDFGDEKDLPYTHDNSARLVEMDDLYKAVDSFADNMANYRDAELEKDAKNSSAS
jgi:hypothetical protein